MKTVNPQDVDWLYEPNDGLMSVVAFASGSGTNFREAVIEGKESERFGVDLLVTDKARKKGEDIGAIVKARGFGIPVLTVNGFRYCGSWQEARQTAAGRERYERRSLDFNAEMANNIDAMERLRGKEFDFAVLAGYMRLVKGELYDMFEGRMVNVHPSALPLGEDGRMYTGDNAVYDTLLAGERRTRSTVIMVAAGVDTGAILVSGPWLEYEGGDVTQESADTHQGRQKEVSDWPALRFTLRAIAEGKLGLHKHERHKDGNPVVVYDGKMMAYAGVEMG